MTWRHIIFGHFDEMKRCNDDVELKYIPVHLPCAELAGTYHT